MAACGIRLVKLATYLCGEQNARCAGRNADVFSEGGTASLGDEVWNVHGPAETHEQLREVISTKRKIVMSNAGRTTLFFLAGLGIGAGLALLFAPQSGEETREWIANTAQREIKMLRRRGRRSARQIQHAISQGEEKLTDLLRDGKQALALAATNLV
jgi:gas vesicle protein